MFLFVLSMILLTVVGIVITGYNVTIVRIQSRYDKRLNALSLQLYTDLYSESNVDALRNICLQCTEVRKELESLEKSSGRLLTGTYRRLVSRWISLEHAAQNVYAFYEIARKIDDCKTQFATDSMACFTALLAINTDSLTDLIPGRMEAKAVMKTEIVPLAESGHELARQFVIDNVAKVL